jgi:hypothetical protein
MVHPASQIAAGTGICPWVQPGLWLLLREQCTTWRACTGMNAKLGSEEVCLAAYSGQVYCWQMRWAVEAALRLRNHPVRGRPSSSAMCRAAVWQWLRQGTADAGWSAVGGSSGWICLCSGG